MQLFSEKFLVIDYGTTHIKGALLQSGGGSYKILRLETLPLVSLRGEELEGGLEEEEELDEYEYNVIRFVQSFFPEEQNFLLNVPLERIYVRDVRVPAVNPKQLAEIIPFEVEGVLPVSLEEAEVIGQSWETVGDNSSVITFTAKHDSLESAVRPVLRGETSIRMLSVDAVGLAGFARLLPVDDYRNRIVGQIDIGGEYTIFNCLQDGRLVFTRQLPYGGQSVTETIAEMLGIDIESAEVKKLDLELNLGYDEKLAAKPDAFFKRHRIDKKDYEKIIKALREIFDDLAAEIDRSILALPCENPVVFFLSGGGSMLGGVREYLEDRLEYRVQQYPLALTSGQPAAAWATALGTAEHYRQKAPEKFDFLNSPFGSTLKGGRFNVGIFSTPILFISGAVIIFLLGLLLSIWQDRREIRKYQTQVAQIARNIPGLGQKNSVEEYLRSAQKMCRDRLASEAGQAGGPRVLEVLQTLTELTPGRQDMDFRFSSFQYDDKSVQVVAELADITQVPVIEQKYRESALFSNVEVVRPNVLPNGRVRLTLTLTLKATGAGVANLRCR